VPADKTDVLNESIKVVGNYKKLKTRRSEWKIPVG
jgi:hypothetical protein